MTCHLTGSTPVDQEEKLRSERNTEPDPSNEIIQENPNIILMTMRAPERGKSAQTKASQKDERDAARYEDTLSHKPPKEPARSAQRMLKLLIRIHYEIMGQNQDEQAEERLLLSKQGVLMLVVIEPNLKKTTQNPTERKLATPRDFRLFAKDK
ncbi:hypothetical protein VNI00_017933 [Paramarasmius palmivorus]|uniref:Uncharacterized protein n=1 Tax=Paramarasmius palmivorus TaxID=297713 RepID=A0AAW0B3L3_9AGAR